jgi:hydrogenase expression/formation protein HypE
LRIAKSAAAALGALMVCRQEAPEAADAALEAMHRTEASADAAVIGEVRAEPPGRVLGRTAFGGHRIIDVLVGDPLPRIC